MQTECADPLRYGAKVFVFERMIDGKPLEIFDFFRLEGYCLRFFEKEEIGVVVMVMARFFFFGLLGNELGTDVNREFAVFPMPWMRNNTKPCFFFHFPLGAEQERSIAFEMSAGLEESLEFLVKDEKDIAFVKHDAASRKVSGEVLPASHVFSLGELARQQIKSILLLGIPLPIAIQETSGFLTGIVFVHCDRGFIDDIEFLVLVIFS